MDSKTKTEFSPETIQKLVESQFGSATRVAQITPLTDGWFNTAYDLQVVGDQADMILRIAPDPEQRVLTYEREMMRKELLIYKTIESLQDIPIPRLLAFDTSRILIARDYMFTEKFSGEPFNKIKENLSPDMVQSIEKEIGVYAARLHTHTGDSFGYFGDGPGSGSQIWRGAFLAFIDALLSDSEALGVQLPLGISHLHDLLHKYAAALDEILEPSLVHWDMWAGNIFVIPENDIYRVEGIIDWERALWGDPEIETAICCKFYGNTFFDGYGRDLLVGDDAKIRQCMYRLYLWLIMLTEEKVRFEGAAHIPWVREQLDYDLKLLQSF
jgi:aminoglycoside phosphotransferase (APT) family kinase protein